MTTGDDQRLQFITFVRNEDIICEMVGMEKGSFLSRIILQVTRYERANKRAKPVLDSIASETPSLCIMSRKRNEREA